MELEAGNGSINEIANGNTNIDKEHLSVRFFVYGWMQCYSLLTAFGMYAWLFVCTKELYTLKLRYICPTRPSQSVKLTDAIGFG